MSSGVSCSTRGADKTMVLRLLGQKHLIVGLALEMHPLNMF